MYVTIKAQKLGGNFSNSVTDFAEYLDKENEGKEVEDREAFFSHDSDQVSRFEVIEKIDNNAAKLKKHEPRFYSITLNPSQMELSEIEASSQALKQYTRKAMDDYAKHFYRDRTVTANDLVYYGKIERERTFGFADKKVKENQPFLSKISKLEKEIVNAPPQMVKIKRLEINEIKKTIPHKIDGVPVVSGMNKPGDQTHIHLIVSRKDKTNTYSLSPGSKYKESSAKLNGKTVKRGFNRDAFIKNAETVFDKHFSLNRNYILSYQGRKDFKLDPKKFMMKIAGLPANEKALAMKVLKVRNPLAMIPLTPAQVAHKALNLGIKLIRSTIDAGSIGV